jgi:hypothetical protein
MKALKTFLAIVVFALLLAPAFANLNQIDFYVYPNGYTNMTILSDELGGVTNIDGNTRIVLQYINTTDSQVYGTFAQGPTINVPIPGSLSTPFQTLTDSDYQSSCETDYGNVACLNISGFASQNQSEIGTIYSAIVPNLAFSNGSDLWYYDYSQYWATDMGSVFNFSLSNWNVTSIVPVLHPYKIYRNAGKIALVSKALPSTPDIWFDDSLTDKHVRYKYASNYSTFACYGDENNLPGVFCDVPVSGFGKSITVGVDRYIYLVGDDFTDATTEYWPLFSLTSMPAYGQSYFNGDDGTATLNHAVLLGPNFFQNQTLSTTCDLETQMPLQEGGCYTFVPQIPTGRFVWLESGFLSFILAIAMVLVAMMVIFDRFTGGKGTKQLNSHMGKIIGRIK